MQANGFSIIVCAHNSETRLLPTIEHISKLVVPDSFSIELILVDNASSDNTASFAFKAWATLGSPFPLKVITEHRLGLSYARRAGVLNSKYKYGVFCDDDNWLNEFYLIEAFAMFNSNEQIGVIGGCSTPVSDAPLPAWFYNRCGFFAVGIQAIADGDVTNHLFVWGAGMCFLIEPLKNLYERGIIPLTTDRKGSSLSSGGDSEICSWFILAGYKLYYTQALKFQHYMEAYRLTPEYFHKFFFLFIEDNARFWLIYSKLLILRFRLLPSCTSGLGAYILGIFGYIKLFLALAFNPFLASKAFLIQQKIRRSLYGG